MPIGSMYCRVSRNRLSGVVVRCLGVPDLHTHIRLRPILRFFRDHVRAGTVCRVLEIGCGDGINAFELARLAGQKGIALHYRGVDIDPQRLEAARRMAHALGLESCTEFLQANAADATSLSTEPLDFLILADILEHVDAPERLLADLRPALCDSSICLVSVPTSNYERVFGASFHRKVGHVRSGYRLEELDALFAEIGGRLIDHRYSTGLVAALGCAIYYRLPATRRTMALKTFLLLPFRVLDLYNSPTVSCSLFAAYHFPRHIG